MRNRARPSCALAQKKKVPFGTTCSCLPGASVTACITVLWRRNGPGFERAWNRNWRRIREQLRAKMGTPANPQNRRRSERVMLQVAVTVLAETPEHEQVREETQTLVVNAHGGL